jgi:hypothetical protein
MSVHLIPCGVCARHVRHGACTCPFCGAPVSCEGERTGIGIGRTSRSMMISAGAVGLVLGTGDCSAFPITHYGAPPVPVEDSGESDAAAALQDGSPRASEDGNGKDGGI